MSRSPNGVGRAYVQIVCKVIRIGASSSKMLFITQHELL